MRTLLYCAWTLQLSACGGIVKIESTGAGDATASGQGELPTADVAAAVQAACPDIAAADDFCVTLDTEWPASVYAVAPSASGICSVAILDSGVTMQRGLSIAVLGGDILLCNGVLTRFDLAGGSEQSGVPCVSVAVDAGRIFVNEAEAGISVGLYSSFADVLTHSPADKIEVYSTSWMISARGKTLWAVNDDMSYVSASSLESYDIASAAPIGVVDLQFSDKTDAFDVSVDGELFLLPLSSPGEIQTYDALTGSLLATVNVGMAIQGLYCWSRP